MTALAALIGAAGLAQEALSSETGTTVPLHTGCGVPSSGSSYTHTYAEAGVEAFLVMVLVTSCPDGQGPPGLPLGVDLVGCVAVGPNSARSTNPVSPVCCG